MSVVAVFIKDPNATLDYQIDWSDWLNDDIIIGSTWITEDGLTKVSDSFVDTVTTVWFSGGIAASRYESTNRIITANGRVDDRTLRIKCKEK